MRQICPYDHRSVHGRLSFPCGYSGLPENVRMDRWDRAMAVVRSDCPMPGTIGRVCVRPCESHCRRGLLDAPLAIIVPSSASWRTGKWPVAFPWKRPVFKKKHQGGHCGGRSGRPLLCLLFRTAGVCLHHFRIPGRPRWAWRPMVFPPTACPEMSWLMKQIGSKPWGRPFRMASLSEKTFKLKTLQPKDTGPCFSLWGAPESSRMRCEGEDAGFRCFMTGVDFLARSARGKKNRGRQPPGGHRRRQCGPWTVSGPPAGSGFEEVTLLYRRTEAEMPADLQEIREAGEEGVRFLYLVAPVEILARDNAVCGLKCRRMDLGEPDASGRRRPVPCGRIGFCH